MLKRFGFGLGVLAFAACANDYEQFDFSGKPPTPDASPQGGSAGTTQGRGGQAGMDAARPDSSGTGGQGGSSGSPSDAQAGTSGTGGAGGTAGSGASGGTGGSGGTGTCGQFEVRCGTSCVDSTQRGTCGGCDNDCEQQGFGMGFQCIDAICGCTGSSQCGQNMSARCSMLSGRCVCNGATCGPGETCSFGGNCNCNGGPSCDDGEVCCQNPAGCRASCN